MVKRRREGREVSNNALTFPFGVDVSMISSSQTSIL